MMITIIFRRRVTIAGTEYVCVRGLVHRTRRSLPGEFDIFTRARVNPTPGHLENVEFPPLGTAFCPKQV